MNRGSGPSEKGGGLSVLGDISIVFIHLWRYNLGRFDCRVQEIVGVESESTVSKMNEQAIRHFFYGDDGRGEFPIHIELDPSDYRALFRCLKYAGPQKVRLAIGESPSRINTRCTVFSLRVPKIGNCLATGFIVNIRQQKPRAFSAQQYEVH